MKNLTREEKRIIRAQKLKTSRRKKQIRTIPWGEPPVIPHYTKNKHRNK